MLVSSVNLYNLTFILSNVQFWQKFSKIYDNSKNIYIPNRKYFHWGIGSFYRVF